MRFIGLDWILNNYLFLYSVSVWFLFISFSQSGNGCYYLYEYFGSSFFATGNMSFWMQAKRS